MTIKTVCMRYILCVVFSAVFFIGFSQNYFDIAKVSYTNTPPNDFEISEAQTNVEEFALELNVPIIIDEKTTLLTGFFSNRTKLKLDTNTSNSNLFVLGLHIGVNQVFNEQWSATFMTFTKIASDEISLSKENLQLAVLSLVTQKKREDLKYKYGLYANTEKYGLLVVPILGLYYVSPSKKFEADLNLPIIADINYRIRNKLWLGMKFDGLGTTYHLNEQKFSPNSAYVSKVSNELVGYVRFQLSKSLYLNTKVGYAIQRDYEVYDSDDKMTLALGPIYFGDDRTRLNEHFKDGAIFKVELFYRLHFD